jgi:hypothetical protein
MTLVENSTTEVILWQNPYFVCVWGLCSLEKLGSVVVNEDFS